MQVIRVVMVNNVRVSDSTDVLRSLDELSRIVVWAEFRYAPTAAPVLPIGSSWRSVQGLSIARIQSGSEIFDLLSVLGAFAAGLGSKGVLEQVFGIAERVFRDRSHRLNMNEIIEGREREELNHSSVMNKIAEESALRELDHTSAMRAIERTSRLNELRGQMVPVFDDPVEEETRPRQPQTPVRDKSSRLVRSRDRANELDVQDLLDGLILPQGTTEEQVRALDSFTIDAYSGAVTAVARANRAQRRGQPVEHFYLLDDEMP